MYSSAVVSVALLTGCTAARTPTEAPPTPGMPSVSVPTSRLSTHRPSATPSSTHSVPASQRPVIVIDPGHSVTVSGVDATTGLDTSDYENEPEMQDVYAVAQLTATRLRADGYRVVLTKAALDTPTTLGRRVAIADAAHPALVISIHDQAGSNGGIGFDEGNNTVYYQRVGDYRVAPSGRRTTFDDTARAAASQRCGTLFRAARQKAEGHPVTLLGDTGYDLGSRGLDAGDIWTVQLLTNAVWIYNEAGGNSAGRSGLDAADQRTYAAGLVAGAEACVPVTAAAATSG